MSKADKKVRIVIADDHPIFRDGLRKLLETEPDLQVIAEAGDGGEAVRMVQRHKPDIVLMDLAMPKRSGLQALRDLSGSSVLTRVIILAATVERGQLLEALQLGARGVVSKESATKLLLKSIRTVMAGQYWVGRESVSDLVNAMRTVPPTAAEEPPPKNYGLTPREMEVVKMIVVGYSNREIGQKLGVSEQTIKHHLTSAFDKLGVYNRLELALFAVDHRLMTEEVDSEVQPGTDNTGSKRGRKSA
jgi:two-component system, NarL family, nitrate/nitrite response regulator NarL